MSEHRSQGVVAGHRPFTRRRLLGAAAAAAAVVPAGVLGARAWAQDAPALTTTRKITLAWGQTAVCQSPISVALERGFFAQYGLEVEPVNFSGPTDQLLQAIATGHTDGGIGMALRWLKPLEQGFDVGLTVGTHGGCMRLLTSAETGIASLEDLRGKSIAVSDLASPVRNYFAIRLHQIGIDPDTDVTWVQYTADLFAEALAKGEVQATAGDDPHQWLQREREGLIQVATNLEGPYADGTCCVLGLRGSLIRDEPEVASAISRAIVDAQAWTAANPDETAEIFAPFVPTAVTPAEVAAMLREHTHQHHSTGDKLRAEIKLFADDLQSVGVILPTTDTALLSSQVVADVIG